jgi:hypothetical protein
VRERVRVTGQVLRRAIMTHEAQHVRSADTVYFGATDGNLYGRG